jgi:hypothetical protein
MFISIPQKPWCQPVKGRGYGGKSRYIQYGECCKLKAYRDANNINGRFSQMGYVVETNSEVFSVVTM